MRRRSPSSASSSASRRTACTTASAPSPSSQREALTLRYFGALHIAEIATVLGRSEGAVKLLIHRALTTLRDQYRQEEQE